jgi:hypothetical protein
MKFCVGAPRVFAESELTQAGMTLTAAVRDRKRRRKSYLPTAPACTLLKNPQDEDLTSGAKEACAFDGVEGPPFQKSGGINSQPQHEN